jgi:hypothetical protein
VLGCGEQVLFQCWSSLLFANWSQLWIPCVTLSVSQRTVRGWVFGWCWRATALMNCICLILCATFSNLLSVWRLNGNLWEHNLDIVALHVLITPGLSTTSNGLFGPIMHTMCNSILYYLLCSWIVTVGCNGLRPWIFLNPPQGYRCASSAKYTWLSPQHVKLFWGPIMEIMCNPIKSLRN